MKQTDNKGKTHKEMLLKKRFLKKRNITPQLRFLGFTKDWITYKLGNLGSTYTGLWGKTKTDFGHGDAEFITYVNVYTNTIADRNGTGCIEIDPKQNEVQFGDVLFTISSEIPEEVGMSSVWLENIPNVYLNSFCFGYRPFININPFYLAYLLRSSEVRKKIILLAQGVSRYNISKSKMMELYIPVPCYEEQTQIGSFFKKLDNTIFLYEQELDNLRKIKQGLLQKMFPKRGEEVPELRFPGFAKDWNIYKLGNLGSTYTGLSGKTKTDFGHGDAEFITYVNVYSNTIANRNGTECIEIDPKQNEVQFGDVLFTISSEVPEEIGMSSVWLENIPNVYLNSFCFGYRPSENINPFYLAYLLRSSEVRKKIMLLAQGISRYNISKNKMMQLYIPVPCYEEQTKVGNFFKKLDDTIFLYKELIKKLKQTRKALIQKMLV